jgi:hypothetical protein
MPVNMDPKKRTKKGTAADTQPAQDQAQPAKAKGKKGSMDEVTERDKELAAADAEWKNLWDETEVIDMDRW